MNRILLALLDFTLALVFAIAAGLTIVCASKTGAMFDEHRARVLRESEVSDGGVSPSAPERDSPEQKALQSPPGED
jgi:hypothetical protein